MIVFLYKPKLDKSILLTSLGPIDKHISGYLLLTFDNLALLKLAIQTLSSALHYGLLLVLA